MISMAPDQSQPWSRSGRISRRRNCELYEYLKREWRPHADRTEVVPSVKYLPVALWSIGLASCTPVPPPGVVKHASPKDDDNIKPAAQECRPYRGIVGSLQYLAIDRCPV